MNKFLNLLVQPVHHFSGWKQEWYRRAVTSSRWRFIESSTKIDHFKVLHRSTLFTVRHFLLRRSRTYTLSEQNKNQSSAAIRQQFSFLSRHFLAYSDSLIGFNKFTLADMSNYGRPPPRIDGMVSLKVRKFRATCYGTKKKRKKFYR